MSLGGTGSSEEPINISNEEEKLLTVSLLGSRSFRILKKFLPYCRRPLMNRFCGESEENKNELGEKQQLRNKKIYISSSKFHYFSMAARRPLTTPHR